MNLYQRKHMDNETLLSSTITWLRFPLMVAVIFIHVNPNVNIQSVDFTNLQWMDAFHIIGTLCSNVISHLAVPCFFMFSGFLYFYKIKGWTKDLYFKKIKKRGKTLLIPYIIWNLIPILIYAFLNLLSSDVNLAAYIKSITDEGVYKIFWDINEWGTDRVIFFGWNLPNTGPYNLPLWFLRDLLVIVVLSPVIYYFIKYTKLMGLLILGIIYYTKIWFFVTGISIMGLFFFSLGAYFSIHRMNFITEFSKGKYFWFLTMFLSMLLTTHFDNTNLKNLFFPIFRISGVVSVIMLVSHLLKKEKIKVNLTLSDTSFFMYLTHAILILSYSIKCMEYIVPSGNVLAEIIKYLGGPILTILVCVLLYHLLKKIMPRFLGILLGDR